MSDPVVLHRLQFAFTIIYHYLFPVLTMGLALPHRRDEGPRPAQGRRAVERRGAVLDPDLRHQLRGRRGDRHPDGVPVRDQLGAVLALFGQRHRPHARDGRACSRSSSSRRSCSLLVWGEKRLSRRGHFFAAVALFLGSWLSGYFITATNAFMQHPWGTRSARTGTLRLADFGAFPLQRVGDRPVRPQHDRRPSSRPRSSSRRSARSTSSRAGTASRPPCSCASASSAGWCRASSSPFRPATARPSSWRRTSRSRWPRWKAASAAARTPS